MTLKLQNFTDVLGEPDEIGDSQPLSLSSVVNSGQYHDAAVEVTSGSNIAGDLRTQNVRRPEKGTGQCGEFRSVDEIDPKYRNVFSYPFFNLVQSRVIEDALYSDKSMVICAPTGSGKTVVFEMAIVRLLMEIEEKNENYDFKIIYMAPVKALCTERLIEWHSKFTRLGLLCIEVTGDTDVDFSQLKPYRIIITTPEKWDMLTRRWRDHSQLVEVIKLFLIDEVHILNDASRGPVLEAVVSRMKTIETSVQSTYRIEQLRQQYHGTAMTRNVSPSIRFVAVSATVSNPEDVATWLGTSDKPAVYYKFGDECRPVKLKRVVEGYHCAEGTSIFKFDLVLNYKLWPIIQKYHDGKPTLIFCNTRKSVAMTAETLSREITISFNAEQKARLTALASTIKNKKLQTLVLSGVGCHHAGLLYEERTNIEQAFRNRDLPILITTTTLAMGVNLPAHLVIIKNTQQYVSGAYQNDGRSTLPHRARSQWTCSEYSISTVLQMVGRAGRPQFDTEATAVIMTRLSDKPRYQALVGGCEPLQSYLHKRLAENLNSEAALGTVSDVAQCVQWLRSTFLFVRAAKDPKRYLGLPPTAPNHHISKKIEELCVKAMNSLASSGLITMDEACCIESTEAGRLMSIFYLDLETMKHIMKIEGSESMDRLLWIVCESQELADMHLRMDERRFLNTLNRNNAASTIRFPMKGKITTRQMKLNCVIQAILGCLPIPDPSLNQEATKIMRIADRVCKCLVAYVTRPALVSQQPKFYSAVLNTITLAKCVVANLWENSPFVSKQLRGIGPTFSTLLATAGKVNFMLLEESHPRDLERIMNKGPPAGNIIRKQISLLPKYQLTITPVDEKVVSIQLVLLNHHNLSENMDHLTAGTAHKSYLIIGDSENILLQLSSFSDKDLIGVYDGSITYQISRKHGFEHKIYAHCISSIVAGIDAQCQYIFKDVEPQPYPQQTDNDDFVTKPVSKKQTTITDIFKERKRKNTDSEIAQSKEKKKRESALFEKFKNLKESFGKTSKVLKDDLDKSAVMSEKILQELTYSENPDIPNACHNANVRTEENYDNKQQPVNSALSEPTYGINENDFINDEFMDEDKINEILNGIECEITKRNSKSESGEKTIVNARNDDSFTWQKTVMPTPVNTKNSASVNSQITNYKTMNNKGKRFNKNVPKKSNYNFIDLLEKNIDLSDAEEIPVQEENSFSDAIKSHIEKYLQKAKTNINPPNRVIDLLQDEPVQSKESEPIIIVHDSKVISEGNDTGRIDTIMAITSDSNDDALTLPDREKGVDIFDTSKQVAILQHKINSLDLKMDELQNINRNNIQDIDEENELPAVRLHHDNSKNYDISIACKEGTIGCRIDGDYNYADTSTSSNLIEIQNKTTKTKFITDENNQVAKLNEEQELVLDEHLFHTGNGSNNEDTDRDKTNVATMYPVSQLKEKLELTRVEQHGNVQKQIDAILKDCENRNLMANNEQTPTVNNFQSSLEHNFDEKKPMTLPNTNYKAQTNEKQGFRGLELWKNYIKELPPLPLEVNNKAIPYNNFMHFNEIGTEKTPTQQNNWEKQPLSKEVKETREFTEIAKPKNKGGFIPPYKHPNTDANIKTIALPNATTLGKPSLLEVESINTNTGNKDITFSEATDVFSKQPTFTKPFYYSQKQPLLLSNTVSCIPELQEKLNNPMTVQNYPAHPQLHYRNENVPFNLPNTKSFMSELKAQGSFDVKSTTLNNEMGAYNKPNTCVIGNRTFCDENYGSSYTNNEKQNINKYSFTSTKTDVSTQETADHVVRVIRNLRIDLDITEIVSKAKKSMENDSADIEENIDKNEEYQNPPIKRLKLANDEGIDLCYEKTNNMQSVNSRSGFDNATRTLSSEKLNRKTLEYSDELLAEPKSLDDQIHQPLPTTKKKELISSSTEELMQVDKDKEVDNTFSNYKIKDVPEKKPNNVMNILQKYSNIIRNNTINTANLTQIKASEKTSNAAKKDKPNRPFKISDIHRSDPTLLPGVMIEITKPVNVTECFNLLEPKDKQAQLEQNKQLNIISDLSVPKLSERENKYNEDSQEVTENKCNEQFKDVSYCDPFTDLEVKDTLDQTMLNPITLLQCFSNHEPEEIVPPPPEFSDYSDTTFDTADFTLPTDRYEPMAWEDEKDEARKETPRSIFQDNRVELTPSKEIETWNLSQDEGSCKMYASPGPSPYSFTIMRKNKQTKDQIDQIPLEGSLLQNTTLSRHNRLKQFKFNHKNKFRM